MVLGILKGRGAIEYTIAMLISGSIGIFVMLSGQDAVNVVFFRCLIALVLLAPYCWKMGYFRKRYFTGKSTAFVLAAGSLLVINWLLLFKAYPLTSISWATVVYHINPFLVLIGGALFLRQPLTRETIAWTIIAFIGLMFLSRISESLYSLDKNMGFGLILVLAASTMYSGTTLLMKSCGEIPPALAVCLQTGLGVLILIPFLSVSTLPDHAVQWMYLALLGSVHTFLLYYLIFSSFKILDIRSIAILSFIYPLSAAALDYLIFGHKLSRMQWVGAGLIFISTLAIKLNWPLPRHRPNLPFWYRRSSRSK